MTASFSAAPEQRRAVVLGRIDGPSPGARGIRQASRGEGGHQVVSEPSLPVRAWTRRAWMGSMPWLSLPVSSRPDRRVRFVSKRGVSVRVPGEGRDRVHLPAHPRQVCQAQLPDGVRGESLNAESQPIRLTTFDQDHRLSGWAWLRRDCDRNNGSRARLTEAR